MSATYSTIDDSATVLPDLAHLHRYVAYSGVIGSDGKMNKAPINPNTGLPASTTKPKTWGTKAMAIAHAKSLQKPGARPGIGYVLGDAGDYWTLGIDLDGCLKGGRLEPWAQTIKDRFDSYTDESPSGEGAKIVFKMEPDDVAAVRAAIDGKAKKDWKRGSHYGVELHLNSIHFAITGREYEGDIGGPTARFVAREDVLWLIHEAGPAFEAGGPHGTTGDKSNSAAALKFLIQRALDGMSFDGAFEAMRADKGQAGAWASYAPEREIKRTWAKAEKRAEELRDLERMLGMFTDDMVDGSPYDPPPTSYTLDDHGIIRAFTDRYGGRLRFDHDTGKWLRFEGWWREERTRRALHLARGIATDLAKRDAKQAKALRSYKTWANVEQGARADPAFAVTSDLWNADPMLLGTPGGTVDLRTGKLRKGMPGDYISRVTAVAPGGECPTWLAFLNQALQGDAGAIRLLQQWGGYSLSGDTSLEKLLFVYGPGGSGKSTAINTIADIMGDYAINVGMETLTAQKHQGHTQELARLRGARMARASEIEKGAPWAEARIKMLTGRDKITARFMRQDDFEFAPEFKLTVFGNSRPTLRDVDDGMRRRLLFLPFMHQPHVKDPTLKDRLRAEWGGILSWLIAGCLDWQANGLAVPEVARAATDEYFAGQDVFGQWLAECCEVGPTYAETTAKLWESWSRYAYAAGAEPGSKTAKFPETLTQHQFKSIKDTKGIRGCGYSGLRLRPAERDEAERFG